MYPLTTSALPLFTLKKRRHTTMAASHRLTAPRKILVKDLNDYLTCNLCGGYFVDATAVIDCSHTFCRACIVRHFESSRFCPNCGSLVHKSKPLSKLRSDATLQSLIYKTIPALYTKELQRRTDFYHSTGFRANSSCSDDSVLGDSEEWVNSNIGDPTLYFSPDDSVSLSVEYYQPQPGASITVQNTYSQAINCTNTFVQKTDTDDIAARVIHTDADVVGERDDFNVADCSKSASASSLDHHHPPPSSSDSKKVILAIDNNCNTSDIKETANLVADGLVHSATDISVTTNETGTDVTNNEDDKKVMGHKRFLQCPAAVKMVHLMKFLRMKFALSNEHRVDIIYAGEVLPPYLSLMDVAYTFKWNRAKPMRFFYLIYIPIKQPVLELSPPPPPPPAAAITAPSVLTKEVPKLLELPPPSARKPIAIKIEPIKTEFIPETILITPPTPNSVTVGLSNELKKETNNNVKLPQKSVKFIDEPPKIVPSIMKLNESSPQPVAVHSKSKTVDGTIENCVYDYTEPDKDEIKAFAERRDREWALQKHADTLTHISKKRKKNKHAKNEFIHKKRKLHAEITSSDNPSKTDDSLKLKVKLSVPNGHKHKHRNNPTSSIAKLELPKPQELSPKERLLQMRQVRHKNIATSVPDEKAKSAIPELVNKPPAHNAEPHTAKQDADRTSELLSTSKTLRSDFTFKTAISKDICSKYVRINLEKCPDGKPTLAKKPGLVKTIEKADKPLIIANKPSELKVSVAKLPDQSKSAANEDKSKTVEGGNIDKEIETKSAAATIIDESKSIENKLNNIDFKSVHQSATLITKNFTVSKVEQGVKRKLEPLETSADKRPSLEITVINVVSLPGPTNISAAQSAAIQTKPISSSSSTQTKTTTVTSLSKPISSEGAPPKKIRPPPLTIPLGRIKEMNLKSNAMAAKAAEKCDIFGALDLSAKPNKETTKPEFQATTASQKPAKSADHQLRLTASPRPKPADQTRSTASPKLKPIEQARSTASPRPKPDQIRLKTPLKIDLKAEPVKSGEKKPNISNLQLLSESAVQIREMMVKNSGTSTPIPNLIKKIPNIIGQNASLKAAVSGMGPKYVAKPPHLIPKTPTSIIGAKAPNFLPKGPNFLPKNLQKLPKLNEINKTQFGRLNSNAQPIRNTRPAGQNQSIRNIPNPSLLVRQQNQNRINSMANAASCSNGLEVVKDGAKLNVVKPQMACTENHDTEKKATETKASEPPPLKPIEGYKK